MAKILTGGVAKAETADAVRRLALDGVEVTVSSDLDAATRLRAGLADYYFGTCHTGAGASLGVLVGLVGQAACHTFGRSVPDRATVESLLDQGKKVFGFSLDQIDTVVPLLADAVAARG